MPNPFDEAESKLKAPNPFDQAEQQYRGESSAKGPRQYSEASERRGRHSLTGREAKPKSSAEEFLNIAEGAGKITAAGTAIPALVADAPGTILGAAGAAGVGYAGKKAAEEAGASPTTSRAIGDVAALAGGAAGAKFGPRAVSAITPEFIAKRISGLGDYLAGIRERWNSYGKTALKPVYTKSNPRPDPAWKSGPGPKPEAPADVTPIKSELPSGRKVGRLPTPKTEAPKPAETSIEDQIREEALREHNAASGKPVAEQLRDEIGGGEVDPETGVKTIPQPEDVRAADRAKLSPRGKKSLAGPKTGANASPHPERSKMLGEALKAAGFTPEAAKSLSAEDWHAVAQQVGIETPDQATVEAAIKSLR